MSTSTPHPQPLAVQLGELPEMFKRYRLGEWARVHSIDYWTDTNWKLYVENNTENYHEPTVHPCLIKYYKHIKAEARHYYYLQYTPSLTDGEGLAAKTEPELSIDGLNEKERAGVSTMSFFPNFAWILEPNIAIIYLIDPQGVSRTRVRWDWLVPNTEAAKSSENLEPLIQFLRQHSAGRFEAAAGSTKKNSIFRLSSRQTLSDPRSRNAFVSRVGDAAYYELRKKEEG